MRYDFAVMNTASSVSRRALSLRQWYRRPLGRLLAGVEFSALADELPNIFGYHLLVVDPPWDDCTLSASRIPHQVVQRAHTDPLTEAGLIGDTESWPVMTDTVDAIILPHTLEMTRHPHQVLREADRSLIPDGHLVILGFNPRSLWGMQRVLSRRSREMPWAGQFHSMHRLKDWLSLLGFDTLESRFLFHRPPLQNTRLLEKLKFLEPRTAHGRMLLAGSYILVARKRTMIMTAIKAGHTTSQQLFPVGIPSSSQRNMRRAG
jgi:SAM-dependent methyltransferase